MATGRVEALARFVTQDAFEAGVDSLATAQFMAEMEAIFADPAFPDLVRLAQVAALSPTAGVDDAADGLLEDLLEYSGKASRLPAGDQANPRASSVHGMARLLVAVTGLALAARGRDRWASWMPGMLWHEGRRGVLELAAARGIGWAQVAVGAVTQRDAMLRAKPFDRAASDRAAKLLGLDG